jgi:alginate O-acetyltransferase complex protein AlgJ
MLSGRLGVGNERVYQGRDGWLFYRSDVDYVIGAGFLDTAGMRRRVESDREWLDQPQPDPRQALVEFKRQLEQRGIALVVVPTPVKPAMHPEKLASRRTWTIPVQNPSYGALLEDLRRDNVKVFDVAAALARDSGGSTGYLATDTHWRPETMERTAELLGRFIQTEFLFGDAPSEQYRPNLARSPTSATSPGCSISRQGTG